jgi:acyl-CoA thioesterase
VGPTYFDRTTAVTPAGASEADGARQSFSADLDAGWVVGGGVNGGYLLAVMGRALRAAVPAKPDPIAVSAHYVGASVPGPAEVTVAVRREGRQLATAAVDLVQDGGTRITALATVGDLAAGADDVATTAEPFALPPLEECVSNRHAPPELRAVAPLMERFDMRFDPALAGWAVGQPAGRAELAAWFRLEDDRDPDVLSLLLAVDALPPVTFGLGRLGWAPTIELTAHVRAHPAPGWLRLRHVSRNIAGGLFEEDCEVWDSADRLVAQSRQLARLPR